MKRQLNVTLGEETAKRIKMDAVSMGITLQDWASIAFSKFLQLPVSQRRATTVGVKRKTLGRPVEG